MAGALTAGLLGLGLLGCGLGFNTPSLTVAGVGLTGLTALAILAVELARPRSLVRAPGPDRVMEGESFELLIEARGARIPPPGGRLTDSVLPEPVAVGPRWRGVHRTTVALEGRGRRQLEPARLQIGDPLGLHSRTVESDAPGHVLILPRLEPVVATGRGAGGLRPSPTAGIDEGLAASRMDVRAIELEVDGLRAYREGTPASRIHWPSVARTGELLERRLVAGSDAAPLVVMDASSPADLAALDAAVRAAASLTFHLAGQGGCAVLMAGDRRPADVDPERRSWPQVHARLALIEAGGPAPPVSRTVRAGTVFWVTAAARPALPAALRTGIALRYVVHPAADGARGAFTVAGCVGRLARARASEPAGAAA